MRSWARWMSTSCSAGCDVGLASRHALGLWFLGIAVLGLVQFLAMIGRGAGGVQPDAVAWTWLSGSLLAALVALLLAWRERNRGRGRQPRADPGRRRRRD